MNTKLSKLSPAFFPKFATLDWKCVGCGQTIKIGQTYHHKEADMVTQGTMKHPFKREGRNVICLVCERPVIKE